MCIYIYIYIYIYIHIIIQARVVFVAAAPGRQPKHLRLQTRKQTIWGSINRGWETGIFAWPEQYLTGMRESWLSDP